MLDKYLNNRIYTLYLIPFIIGSITVFTYQPFNYFLLNFIILPVFFYLIVYIKKRSKSIYRKKPFKKNLFIFGTCFGFGFYLSGIHWITNSLTFDENFKILIPFALILIPLFLSLFFSLTILAVGPYLKNNISSILLFSASLAFSDYLRAKILTGFPWNLWAYSFSSEIEIIQVLNLLGLFAFNLTIITLYMLPAVLFFYTDLNKKMITLFIIFLCFFTLYIYGNHSINKNENINNPSVESFNIKVISPNFNLNYGLSLLEIERRLQRLIRYSEPNDNIKTLIVWPEGVFSGYSYKQIMSLRKYFKSNFNQNHLILFGINREDIEKKEFYNSMIIVNNKLEIVQEYKKRKLVPFGEFLPFESLIQNFGFKKITEGYGSFLRGGKQDNLVVDKLNILPLICYEVIFTKFIQESSENTNLVVNISEDGWFGNSIGPDQHYAKVIFRAIEKNSFLIRSANKGVSLIISNKGEIIKSINSNEIGKIEMNVPLIQNKNKNKNDLIFFILLFTYILIFNFKKFNVTK